MAQTAWGNVTANSTNPPTIEGGSKSTVSRQGQGIYLVHFNAGFTKTPACAVTQQFSGNSKWDDYSSNGGDTRDNAVIITLDKDHVRVKTGDLGGGAQDRNFSFIAIGD